MKKLWHVRKYVVRHYMVLAEDREEAKEEVNYSMIPPFLVDIIKDTAEVHKND